MRITASRLQRFAALVLLLGPMVFPARAAGPLVHPALLSPLSLMPITPVPVTPPAVTSPASLTAPLDARPLAGIGLFPPMLLTVEIDPSLRLVPWSQVFNVAALGEFVIPLRRDPAERANILLAADAVNDVSIAPGETFSFNDVVGERTAERGYQDGWMFDRGQLVRGTGGGICLVATGLYNAALQAGLELVERHPHSGLVTYAPPGCDAGVVYGVEDMKFRNTTPASVLVKTQTEPARVVVKLIGHAPPVGSKVFVKATRFVPLSPKVIQKPDAALLPGQTVIEQKPRTGYEVTVERFFTRRGQTIRRELVAKERRAPLDKIVRVAVAPSAADPVLRYLLESAGASVIDPSSSTPEGSTPDAALSSLSPDSRLGK